MLFSCQARCVSCQDCCEGASCIEIYVAKKTPELLAQIPAAIAGYPAAVEETGAFKGLKR